jgi:hypothetical protein
MIESAHRLVLMASIVGLIVSCSDGAPTVLAPGTRTPAYAERLIPALTTRSWQGRRPVGFPKVGLRF